MRTSLIALIAALSAAPAVADDWPSQTIRIVVGFTPGGSSDLVARLLAPLVSEDLGAEVIVEGKVGEDGEVIYVDPGQGPGYVIEYLQPMAGSEGLFQMMKDAARDWDGTDPVRVLQ